MLRMLPMIGLPGSVAPVGQMAPDHLARDDVGMLEDRAIRLTGVLMFTALFLQRFAIPIGTGVDVVGPIGLAVAAYGLLRGTLALHRGRTMLFLLLAAATFLALAFHVSGTDGVQYATDTNSLSQFLLLTGFAVVSFSQPVDERRFFHTVNFFLMLIAVAGIAQFIAQFVGLKLFAFTGLLPASMLFESGYNLQILIGVGEILKSNGFFLLEPSVLSQMMVLGLIIEVLVSRRLAYLGLFTAGLLLSFSGTGWIVLAGFLVGVIISMGWRGLTLAGLAVAVLGVAGLAAILIVPDFAYALLGRAGEITQPGTSGFLRFITPFWVLNDMLTARPSVAWAGLGSGVTERLTMPYDYAVNTPVKISLDYGFPILLIYLSLFFVARRTKVQTALLLPLMVLFLFTGGYQQFPPILFIVLLLIAVAWLRPSQA